MLSLAELSRLARVLDERFAGHRFERWVQTDDARVFARLYGREQEDDERGSRSHLVFCCDPQVARIARVPSLPTAPDAPPRFVSFLRAHLASAIVRGADVVGGDRQLALHLETREGRFDLLLSIFGKRSNLCVLDADGKIVSTLRSLRDTRPELKMGEPWVGPEGAPPSAGEDRFAAWPDAELLAAIEQEYGPREAEKGASDLRRRIAQVLKKEVKGAARRREKLEAELAEADQASEVQRHGELLKGVLGRIESGASEIEVEDPANGERVTVPLDPKLSPRDNLEATFKRYQKLVRRLTKAGGQIDEAVERCEALDALALELDTLGDDDDALVAFAERPEVVKLLGAHRPPARKGPAAKPASTLPSRLRDLPSRLMPRRFRSRDGLEIWVGRSDEANDYLTTRLARGNDLFFHLDGAPGSHVILRTEGRTDPPQESVLDAAELSVHYSKQKNASRADVHVVPIKNVKKPKGAKRGLVWVTGGKSIHLRREEARLRRVLDAKIED